MKKIIIFITILLLAGLVLVGGMCKKEEKLELKIDKTIFDEGEAITATIKSEKKLFTGFLAFEVQQLVDNEWQYIDIYDMTCALPCSVDESEICYEMPIACAPLPVHCQDFDPLVDKFEWDQTILKTRNVECSDLGEARTCSFKEMTEPGTYKIVFRYSENCVNKDLFEAEENKIQEIQKEFTIRPEYIKVDDFFGEWPIYYDEYVEFEGYVTSVYECPSCPRGAQCEACIPPYYLVYKEPLSHKYYERGHAIVKHRFGEKLEIGRKYKIRGRLLPPEQAFLVGVIGSIPNSELRIVIDPTEPAVEVVE